MFNPFKNRPKFMGCAYRKKKKKKKELFQYTISEISKEISRLKLYCFVLFLFYLHRLLT